MAQDTTTGSAVTMPPLAAQPLSSQLAAFEQELTGDLQISWMGRSSSRCSRR